MIKYIAILINAAVLIYGGVVDFRKREIPNIVPIVLLVTGLLNFTIYGSIIGIVAPAVLLLASEKISKSNVPGGDFKLLCALGFSSGLPGLVITIFFACIGAVVYGIIKQLPFKRHIPLCSYIAPAYIFFQAVLLLLININL